MKQAAVFFVRLLRERFRPTRSMRMTHSRWFSMQAQRQKDTRWFFRRSTMRISMILMRKLQEKPWSLQRSLQDTWLRFWAVMDLIFFRIITKLQDRQYFTSICIWFHAIRAQRITTFWCGAMRTLGWGDGADQRFSEPELEAEHGFGLETIIQRNCHNKHRPLWEDK